jgi:hypothetical protein
VRLNQKQKSLKHGRMTSLSDTLTVGLVLVLLFGSIALYLYTRLQQAEQKISLLESILLDLKMSAEIKTYTELPASEEIKVHASDVMSSGSGGNVAAYKPFDEEESESAAVEVSEYTPLDEIVGTESKHSSRSSSPPPSHTDDADYAPGAVISGYKDAVASALTEVELSTPSVNYDGMTIKELQALAKSRGISSANSMKKASLIEALKTSDRVTSSIEPGSASGTAPFLETSSLLVGVDA